MAAGGLGGSGQLARRSRLARVRHAGNDKWNDPCKPSNWWFPLRESQGSFPHSPAEQQVVSPGRLVLRLLSFASAVAAISESGFPLAC